MVSHKKLLQDVILSNEALTLKISQITASSEGNRRATEHATREILSDLYKSIVQIGNHPGHPRTPRKDIFQTWRSFFDPIQELSKLPSGNFIAARTFLYLVGAFIDEKSINKKFPSTTCRTTDGLYHFCIELDDGLLQYLRAIWSESKKSEEFHWVFAEYSTQNWIDEDPVRATRENELANVISPDELMTLGETQGVQHYYAKPNEESRWFLYTKPTPRWDLGDEYTEELLWKRTGSDGPIRGKFFYYTVNGRDRNEEKWHCIDVLRRSLQFVLDARQIAGPIVGLEKRRLLKKALYRRNIPMELQLMIMNEMVERPPFLYLEDLDIAGAYQPFPKREGPCENCSKQMLSGEGNDWLSCPMISMIVWNLALRMFHVFHRDEETTWQLCKHSFPCSTHHKPGSNWEVESDPDYTNHLEIQAQNWNSCFWTLGRAGFGPMDKMRLDSLEEDELRRQKLLTHQGPFEDSANDLMMVGGIGGLMDCMTHGRILLGAWEGNEPGDGGGQTSTNPQWALGRDPGEQSVAEKVIKDLHMWPSHCEWC